MIRLIKTLSFLGILIAIAQIASLQVSSGIADFISKESDEKTRFHSFPIDQQNTIDFTIDEDSFDALTHREQLDQIRDWLLYTVVSSSDLSIEMVNQVLYDLPTIRHGYMQSTGAFEFGDTRSVYVGDGQVIALLPDTSEGAFATFLNEIADRHRMEQGAELEDLHVFEYGIDLLRQRASITQRKTIDASELFTKENGYIESRIYNKASFDDFVEKIDDVTFARIRNDQLILGGRKIDGYRGIGVSEIATIWQAEKKISQNLEQYEQQTEAFEELLKEFSIFDDSKRLDSQTDEEWEQELRKKEEAWNELQEMREKEEERQKKLLEEAWTQNKLVQGTGFSLDWDYNFRAISRAFNTIEPDLLSLARRSPGIISQERIQNAREGLQKRNIEPLLSMIGTLVYSQNYSAYTLGSRLDEMYIQYAFQKARYDGDLKGTEVGMILFYTDLLSKIWGFNYSNATTDTQIEDFLSETTMRISSIYEAETDSLGSTRTWFGPEFDGVHIHTDEDKLFLGRKAVRVFSASASMYEPGVESPPNALAASFINWWNNHYEYVAAYEPEYERLNEVMKWGLIIGWLNEYHDGGPLSFLDVVPVDRSNWFPTWVREHPELKFQDWNQVICGKQSECEVTFYPPGYQGVDTETMPLLYSSAFKPDSILQNEVRYFFGGVTLPGRASVRATLPKAKLDAWKGSSSGRILHYKETARYQLYKVSNNQASVSAIPKEGAVIRGRFSELPANARFERVTTRNARNVSFETKVGNQNLGDLRIARNGNGFKVRWSSRDIDNAHTIARHMSNASNQMRFLAQHPKIDAVIQLPGNQVLVKMPGSNTWIKISPDGTPLAQGASWSSRVGDVRGQAFQVQLLDDAAVKSQLQASNYTLSEVPGTHRVVWRATAERGPPNLELSVNNRVLNGRVDAKTGRIQIHGDDLAKINPQELTALQRSLNSTEVTKIQSLVRQNTGVVKYQLPQNMRSVYTRPNASHTQIAGEITKNPAAARTAMNNHLSRNLDDVKRLMNEKEFATAIRRIDDLNSVYGAVPELKMWRGVAEISRGRVQHAAARMEWAGSKPLQNRNAFFNEVNGRLGNTSLQTVERANVNTVARYADWKDLRARNLITNGDMSIAARGDQLQLTYRVAQPMKGSSVRPDQLGLVKNKAYVQDSPALNNIDWNASLNSSSLQQLISSKQVTVTRVMQRDLSHFRPAELYNGGVKLRSVSPPKVTLPHVYIPYAGGIPSDGGDDDEEEGVVYFITTAESNN